LIGSAVLCPNFCQVSYGDDDRYSCSDTQGKKKVWLILKFGLGFGWEVDTNTTEVFRYIYIYNVIKPTNPGITGFYARKYHQFTVIWRVVMMECASVPQQMQMRRIQEIRVEVF